VNAPKKKDEQIVLKVRPSPKHGKNVVEMHFEIGPPLESWEPQLFNGIFIIS